MTCMNLEQHNGIEPSSRPWQGRIITAILMLQVVGIHRVELQSSESESDILTIVLYPSLRLQPESNRRLEITNHVF